MRNASSPKRTSRGVGKLPPTLACVLALIFACGSRARAQEGDLAGSAGVFIQPTRARASVPPARERKAPRRSRKKTEPAKPPPVTAKSLNQRAEVAIDAGRFAEAVEPLRQAIKIDGDFADAHYNLGFALY